MRLGDAFDNQNKIPQTMLMGTMEAGLGMSPPPFGTLGLLATVPSVRLALALVPYSFRHAGCCLDL
jgi:hypothetical protein